MKASDKIQELEAWLIANPDHPDYPTVLKDKNRLYDELLNNNHDR